MRPWPPLEMYAPVSDKWDGETLYIVAFDVPGGLDRINTGELWVNDRLMLRLAAHIITASWRAHPADGPIVIRREDKVRTTGAGRPTYTEPWTVDYGRGAALLIALRERFAWLFDR